MTPDQPTIRVVAASQEVRLDLARSLFRAYAAEFAGSIAELLCLQGFEAEVGGLPGRYSPPSGCLLLAIDGDMPAGCVALRDLGEGTCEIKRLYVSPEHRGRGVGSLLVEEVVRRAEEIGYRRMVLDTLPEMAGAIALYRRYGFAETTAYWGHPDGQAVFMERRLESPIDEDIR